MYKQTESIADLSTALAAAQRMMEGASKDSANPFFKSSYADLASVWNAIREPLAANGLAIMQMPGADGAKVTITTLLTHSSGQWVSSDLTMTAKEDTPQAIGSAITYARRYALQSIAGVAPEDDDGERAQGRQTQPQQKSPQNQKPQFGKPADQPALRDTINDAANRLLEKFQSIKQGPLFFKVLGTEGYTSIAEIPDDYKVAQRVIEALKLALADCKRS